MVRDHGHVSALNQAAMNAATTDRPHRSKQRLPPTPAARAEAAALRSRTGSGTEQDSDTGEVVDLARHAAAAAGRNTQHTISTETIQPGTTNTATMRAINQP